MARDKHLKPATRSPRPAPLALALARIGLCTSLLAPWGAFADGLPTGGSVAQGTATISNTSATQQVVTQSSQRAVINWQGFSIAGGNSVQFVQPGSTSVTLNRVVGSDPSDIFGSLSANGQLFLVNPNGIYFSPTATLDVGGLVATTLNISDSDFMAGNYVFSRAPGAAAATVINEGVLRAREGGYVVLAGDYVANRGVIEARLGEVALASGSQVTLDLQGDQLISLAVNEKTMTDLAGVSNSGQLLADGGRVVMTAAVARDLAGTVVNNSGVIRAGGVDTRNGEVYLTAEGGDVESSGSISASGTQGGSVAISAADGTASVSGSISATGSAGNGGAVTITGQRVGLFSGANIDASGATGGGTVKVGGGQHGADAAVQNAARTYVDPDAVIRADATQNGNGGTVVVWSDEVTRFYGLISAKGGTQGGNGGMAEVSSAGTLVYAGTTNLLAPYGTTGTLLLDPKNIRITTTGTDTVSNAADAFTATPGVDSNLKNTDVVAALTTADLVLQANNDFTIEANIAAGAATHNLTLEAGRHMIFATTPNTTTPTSSTGAVTITLGGGNFSATVNDAGADINNRDAGLAQFYMASGSTITGAGSISIQQQDLAGYSTNLTDLTVTDNTGDFTIGNLSAGTGGITIGGLNSGSTYGNVTLNGTISATGGDISIAADGNLTLASTGSISNSGSGAVNLTTTEVVNTANNILLNGNVSGSLVRLTSADAITQTTGGITATQLAVRAAQGVNDEDVTLNSASNNIGTVAMTKVTGSASGLYHVVLNNGTHTLTVGTVDGITGITAVPGGTTAEGDVTLTAGDLVISNAISTGTSVKGSVTLQPAAGTNATVGAGATGFGVSNAELALVTTGTLRVGNTAGSGSLTVDGAINTATGWTELILRAGTGGITQSTALNGTLGHLGLDATGNITLTDAGNAISVLAANLGGSGQLQFTNNTAFRVDTVGNAVNSLSGVTTANGDATLTATAGIMTLASDVTVGGTHVLTLESDQNGLNQTGGVIATPSLKLLSTTAGGFALSKANAIGTVAADIHGNLGITNGAGNLLTVGSVGGTTGISSGGNTVSLVADKLDINQAINSGAGNVVLTTFTASQGITLGANDTASSMGVTDTELDRITTSGLLTLGDNAHTGAITVTGTVDNAAGGGITLLNKTGGIAINGTLKATAASAVITLTADGGNASAGAISESAGGGVQASSLTTSSSGGTVLTGSGNAVGSFSAVEYGGGSVSLTNTGTLALNGVSTGIASGQTLQDVTISTTGDLTINVAPVNTQNPGDPGNSVLPTPHASSNISLTSTTGAISFNRNLTAGSSGTVTLNAATGITQSGGAITGSSLLVLGAGDATLINTANDVGTVAANLDGALSYRDANGFTVGTVGSTNGVTTTSGKDITLYAAGALVLTKDITTTGAPTIDLTASGISGAGKVAAPDANLVIRDNDTSTTGVYTLSGDVATLAAVVNGTAGAGQGFSFTDAGSLIVSSVAGVTGISAGNGDVALTTASGLTLVQGINTGSGAILLKSTAGGVNQTGGNLIAGGLQLAGAGTFTLDGVASDNNITALAVGDGTSGLMDVAYRDVDTVSIGTVRGVSGATTRGGSLTVIAENGDLTVNNTVDTRSTPGSGATTTGGDVTLTSLAPSTSDIVFNADLTGDIVTFNAQDSIQLNGHTINATVNTSNLSGETWIGYNSDGNFNLSIAADTVIFYTNSVSGVTITQTGGSITATNLVFLGLYGDSTFNFLTGTNTVQNISVESNYFGLGFFAGTSTVNLATQGALNVASVTPTHYYVGTVNGIYSNNKNVVLDAGGSINVGAPLNAGTGNVTLSAPTGGISQTAGVGYIIANTLTLSSPNNSIDLGKAVNNVASIADVSLASGGLFNFLEADDVTLNNISVTNAGTATINVSAGDTISLAANKSLTATSSGNLAAANVTLTGGGIVLNNGSSISATGGGASAGVNAGVTLNSPSGPVTMLGTAAITATDNGPSTAAASAPHSAEVDITSGYRTNDTNCHNLFGNCTATVGNITATSLNGRSVIDVFGQGGDGFFYSSTGVNVTGALTVTGETSPLIQISSITTDNDGNALSNAPVFISGAVTTNSTTNIAVNAVPNGTSGGVIVNGSDVTIGGQLKTASTNGTLAAQSGIVVNATNNININANLVTDSTAGIGLATSGSGNVGGNGVLQAKQVSLLAPKNQGVFNVKTSIPDNGLLFVQGGSTATQSVIDNSAAGTGTLLATLGIVGTSSPPNPDLPVGSIMVKQKGTLNITSLNDTDDGTSPQLEFVADNFAFTPGLITTTASTTVTIRPYSNLNIQVGNIVATDGSALGLSTVLVTGLGGGFLQQFNPDIHLIIGGPNFTGNILVGQNGGTFTLGNMDITFETSPAGSGVIRNYFDADITGPHPQYPVGSPFPNFYPGDPVTDPIGAITSAQVHFIDSNRPVGFGNVVVTVNGTCGASCPGGSVGTNITVPTTPTGGTDPGDGGGGGGGTTPPPPDVPPSGGTADPDPGTIGITIGGETGSGPIGGTDPIITVIDPDVTPPTVIPDDGGIIADGGGTIVKDPGTKTTTTDPDPVIDGGGIGDPDPIVIGGDITDPTPSGPNPIVITDGGGSDPDPTTTGGGEITDPSNPNGPNPTVITDGGGSDPDPTTTGGGEITDPSNPNGPNPTTITDGGGSDPDPTTTGGGEITDPNGPGGNGPTTITDGSGGDIFTGGGNGGTGSDSGTGGIGGNGTGSTADGGATGGSDIADGSGGSGSGSGTGSGTSVAGGGGGGSGSGDAFSGGAGGGGSTSGDGSGNGSGGGGSSSATADGGASGGASIADGSGNGFGGGGSGGTGVAGNGSGGGDLFAGGASGGSSLAGDGAGGTGGSGSGSSGSGVAGNDASSGATGGGSLADGSGSGSGSGSAFAGANGGDSSGGNAGSDTGSGSSSGGTGGSALADGSGGASGGGLFTDAGGSTGGGLSGLFGGGASGGGSLAYGDATSSGGTNIADTSTYAGATGGGSISDGSGSPSTLASSFGSSTAFPDSGSGDSNSSSGSGGTTTGSSSNGSGSGNGDNSGNDLFSGGGSSSGVASTGGQDGGADAEGDATARSGTRVSGSKDDKDRYFEDEHDRNKLRLVGGNKMISVRGDGVNLYQGDRSAGMGRDPAAGQAPAGDQGAGGR